MKDAFDVLMITHAGLCKGYADVLKLILDIDEDDFGTLSFENGESLDLDDTCKSAAQSIVLYNNFLNGGNV